MRRVVYLSSQVKPDRIPKAHLGHCQNYGPFLGPYYNTGPNTGPNLRDPKRDHNFDNPRPGPHHLLKAAGLPWTPVPPAGHAAAIRYWGLGVFWGGRCRAGVLGDCEVILLSSIHSGFFHCMTCSPLSARLVAAKRERWSEIRRAAGKYALRV